MKLPFLWNFLRQTILDTYVCNLCTDISLIYTQRSWLNLKKWLACWQITQRLVRTWLKVLWITCAYSGIDLAHSQTSQNLLIAAGLVRNWLNMLQILYAYSDNNCAHSQMSQSLLNSSQKWHNLVTITFYDLTATATASEYKYWPVHTLIPQLIALVYSYIPSITLY